MTNSLAFIFMYDKSINISKIDSVAKRDIINKENLPHYQKIPKRGNVWTNRSTQKIFGFNSK